MRGGVRQISQPFPSPALRAGDRVLGRGPSEHRHARAPSAADARLPRPRPILQRSRRPRRRLGAAARRAAQRVGLVVAAASGERPAPLAAAPPLGIVTAGFLERPPEWPREREAPASCGKVARHAFPEVAPGDPGQAPQFPNRSRRVVPGGEIRPKFDQHLAKLEQMPSRFPNIGQHRPGCGQHRPAVFDLRQILVNLGPTRSKFGPTLAQIGQLWSSLGRVSAPRATFRRLWGSFSAIVGQLRHSPGSPGGTSPQLSGTRSPVCKPSCGRDVCRTAYFFVVRREPSLPPGSQDRVPLQCRPSLCFR